MFRGFIGFEGTRRGELCGFESLLEFSGVRLHGFWDFVHGVRLVSR